MSSGLWCSGSDCICRALYHRCPRGCARFYCMNCEDKVRGRRNGAKGQPHPDCVQNLCVEVPPSPTYDPETSIISNGGNESPSRCPDAE